MLEPWAIVIIIVGSVIFLGLAGFFGFCFYISSMMANKFCHPKHFKSPEEKIKDVQAIKGIDGLDEYQRTPINFTMSDGYIIHGDYSLNNPKKFVLCFHGHTGNRQGLPKYTYAFYRLGYSLVFVDHRSHGDNERGQITMGKQEHKDALEVMDQMREKFGQDIQIGLFGCSMGGATALLCVNEAKDLSFIVSDCAFASVENLVRGLIKIHKAPTWPILQLTEHYMKKRYNLCYNDSAPKEELKKNTRVPVLFIQGDADKMVYPYNVKELYENDAGPKELVMFEGAAHCEAITTNKQKYYQVIEDFIKKYGGRHNG